MSRYSKDRIIEIDAQIARLMAIYPNISGRKIADTLTLDHSFVCRRMRVVVKANVEEIKRMTIEEDLAEIMSFLKSTLPEIAKIIFDNGEKDENGEWTRKPPSPMAKTFAMNTLFKGKLALLDKKFDAGIFERQLGRLKTEEQVTPEQEELMRRALEYAFNPDRPKPDNTDTTDK